MNHTKNYDLPQWELNDLIRMEDFNSAMTNIEGGLTSNKAAAEAGDAELERKVNAANTKAENAQSVANAAQNAAKIKPYVTGSYTGNGEERTFYLGFRPSFLIVSGMAPSYSTSSTEAYERYVAITGGIILKSRVELTDTGFVVKKYGTPSFYPDLTEKSRVYEYIAFK